MFKTIMSLDNKETPKEIKDLEKDKLYSGKLVKLDNILGVSSEMI